MLDPKRAMSRETSGQFERERGNRENLIVLLHTTRRQKGGNLGKARAQGNIHREGERYGVMKTELDGERERDRERQKPMDTCNYTKKEKR